MFFKFWTSLVLAVVLLGAQSRRLQEAIDLMETKGDYPAAIRLFEQLAKDSDRAVAARALMYMGMCYEKLARQEAVKTYERLIQQFTDQRQIVAEARSRLAKLGVSTSSGSRSDMIVRRIAGGSEGDQMGSLSFDGHFLSFVDWETGDLAIRDLTTGENRHLTNKGSWSESPEYALYSLIAPDNRQVAYSWVTKDGSVDVRVVGIDGSGVRTIYSSPELQWVELSSWTRDGKEILGLFHGKDVTNRIVLLSPINGSVRILKTFDWRYPKKMSLSPDGRYIAYDFPPQEDQLERDIFILAGDGSRESRLVEHPANDLMPVWTPDGKQIVFLSDRLGSLGAWVIPVSEGKPAGTVQLIKPDMGRGLPLGFTRNGSYYYSLQKGMTDVYTAVIDAEAGTVLSPPTAVSQRFVGANQYPEWSPDGKYLAFVSQPTPIRAAKGSMALVIHSLETGKQRELYPRLNYFNRLRWSPDGKDILVNAYDDKNRPGLYLIDVNTAEVHTIQQSGNADYPRQAMWGPGGKSIFYFYVDGDPASLIQRDVETGQEKVIYRIDGDFAVSSDGQWISFCSDDPSTKSAVLKIVRTTGEKLQELLRALGSGACNHGMTWTPDGRHIIFIKGDPNSTQGPKEIWSVSTEDAAAKRLDLGIEALSGLRIHPDGKHIAFTAGNFHAELWVMENFLPPLQSPK